MTESWMNLVLSPPPRVFFVIMGLMAGALVITFFWIRAENEKFLQNSTNLTQVTISQLKAQLDELINITAQLENTLFEGNRSRAQWSVDTYCNQTNMNGVRICRNVTGLE